MDQDKRDHKRDGNTRPANRCWLSGRVLARAALGRERAFSALVGLGGIFDPLATIVPVDLAMNLKQKEPGPG